VQPPSFNRTKKSYTRDQKSLHYRTINLCCRWPHYEQPHSARLLDCQRPTLVVSMKISFMTLFFVLGLKVCLCQAVALHCMLHYEYCMFPTPFRDQLKIIYCLLSAAHRVSDSKISVAIPSSLSLKATWMDVYREIYDGWLRTADSWGLTVVLLD
jgi:hypothetical protein